MATFVFSVLGIVYWLPATRRWKFSSFAALALQVYKYTCHLYATTTKLLQSCPTLCDPIDAAHQAPPSLGFSRQEHWSGLPFPSPMHESEKWKWSRSVVSDPQRPHGLQPSRLLSMGFSRQEYWSGVPLPSPVICMTVPNWIICLFTL